MTAREFLVVIALALIMAAMYKHEGYLKGYQQGYAVGKSEGVKSTLDWSSSAIVLPGLEKP